MQKKEIYMAKNKAETKKSGKRLRLKKSRKATLLKLLVVGFIVVAFIISIKNIFVLRYEKNKLEEEHQMLISEKDQLNDELKNVNDKDYIEEQARIQLRMIKPGEIIYILQEDKEEIKNKEKNDEKDN